MTSWETLISVMFKLVMMTLMLAVREPTRSRGVFENLRASFTDTSCKSVKRQKLIINPAMITQALSLKFAELSRRDAPGGGGIIILIVQKYQLSSDSSKSIEVRAQFAALIRRHHK